MQTHKARKLHRKRIIKRLTAFLLMLMMVITMMPESALAYIGGIRDRTDQNDEKLHSGTFIYNGDTYMYIENEYLHFDICVGGNKDKAGRLCHTIPTALLEKDSKGNPKNLDNYGKQYLTHQIAEKRGGFWNLGSYGVKNYSTKKKDVFVKDSVTGEDKCISVEVNTGNKTNYFINTYFTLVDMDRGSTSDSSFPRKIYLDRDDTTHNWGVRARSDFSESPLNSYHYAGDMYAAEGLRDDMYRFSMQFFDFAKTGHSNVDASIPTVRAEWFDTSWDNYRNLKTTVINGGLSLTKKGTISEVFSDSYVFGAPFVIGTTNYTGSHYLTSFKVPQYDWDGAYGHWQDEYLIDPYEGNLIHDGEYHYQTNPKVNSYVPRYASQFSYEDGTLVSIGGYSDNYGVSARSGNTIYCSQLWGFRDLLSKTDLKEKYGEDPMIQAEDLNVTGKNYLYIVKQKSGYAVGEADSAGAVPSNALASYYGDYVKDVYGTYHFKGGAMNLSTTISMGWNKNEEGTGTDQVDVKLKKDGTLEFPSDKVWLQSPTFKFYVPTYESKSSDKGLVFKGYDVTDASSGSTYNGLVLDINPKFNDAIVSGGIPGNEVNVNRCAIAKNGELVFGGVLALDVLLADIEMQRLSYGNKNGSFKVNGLEAKGSLKAPVKEEGMPALDSIPIFGLSGSEVKGDISTFPDNEHYNFELKLTVENLFETEAQMNLVRLKNGSLCPDSLYFSVNVKADGVGLDITPSTPVVTLTGGGGGVYNIAKQVNGDYISIPPILVKITGKGKIIKIMEGSLNVYAGPSKLEVSAEDIGFKAADKRIDIIKKVSAGYYVNDVLMTYDGIPFQGYEFGGGMGMSLSMIPEKNADTTIKKLFIDTIKSDVSLTANVVAAENQPKNLAYGKLGLTGSSSVNFRIPIIDKEVAGAALDATIRGEGYGRRNSNPIRNMKLKGGIAVTGQAGKLGYGRVIYILPDTLDADADFGTAPDINWDEILNAQGCEDLVLMPETVTMEDGSEMIALVATNLYDMQADVTKIENEETLDAQTAITDEIAAVGDGHTYQITLEDTDHVEDGEGVLLLMIPRDQRQENLDDVQNSVSVNNAKYEWEKVLPEVKTYTDEDGQEHEVIVNNEDITVWQGMYAEDEDNYDKKAIYVQLLKEQIPDDGKILVSASQDCFVSVVGCSNVTELDASIDGATVSGNTVSANTVDYNELTNETVSGNNLEVKISNPGSDTNYRLLTFYGSKDENGEIKQEYQLDSREIKAEDTAECIEVFLPHRGQAAPTGTYYVSAILMDSNNLPIATFADDQNAIEYYNDTTPDCTDSVSLTKIGNESMQATFKEVEDTADVKVDGYRLRIYQEDGNGGYTDTGRGYEFTREQLDLIKRGAQDVVGVSYDQKTDSFSVNMALSVGGEAMKIDEDSEDVKPLYGPDEDGDGKLDVLTEVDENMAGLDTGKDYRLGVTAYTLKTTYVSEDDSDENEVSSETGTDENENMKEMKLPSYGKEVISGKQELVAFKPLTFDVSVGGKQLEKTEGSENQPGIYECITNYPYYINVDSFKSNGQEVSEDNVKVKATFMDLYDEEGNPKEAEMNSWGSINVPSFSGTLMVKLDAVYSHDGVEDTTTEYVKIEYDNAAPALQLDGDVFYTDDDSIFTITGKSEAGAKVLLKSDRNYITIAEADESGVFSFEGKLKMDTEDDKSLEPTVSANEAYQPPKMSENGDPYGYEYPYYDEEEEEEYEEPIETYTGFITNEPVLYLAGEDACGNRSEERIIALSKPVKKSVRTITVKQQGCDYGQELPLPEYYFNDQLVGLANAELTYQGTLRNGTKYESDKAPTQSGTYTVAVEYKDDTTIFTGVSEQFVITPLDLKNAVVTPGQTLTYNGKEQTKTVTTVMVGGMDVPETEYTITGNKATKAGNYKLTVAAKNPNTGNFTGSVTKEFSIARKQVAPAVSLDKDSYEFTGQAIIPEVIVKDGDTVIPKEEYTTAFLDNDKTGTGKVTVKAAADGNYSFEDVTKEFSIYETPNTEVAKEAKKASPITVKAKKKVIVEAAVLQKKAVRLNQGKLLSVKKAKGKVKYKLLSVKKKNAKKYFKLKKNGTLQIKKGLKKGNYVLMIKVNDLGDDKFLSAEKRVKVKIIVR